MHRLHKVSEQLSATSSSSPSTHPLAPCKSASPSSLFLGLDLSTQGLKAAVVDRLCQLKCEASVNFDKDFPAYKTQGGAHKTEGKGGLEVTAPTMMFVEAIDAVFVRLQHAAQKAAIDLSRVVAVASSGQQHGSVYWKKGGGARLQKLDPSKNLKQNLQGAFAIEGGPIWMDSSTGAYCRAIEAAMGDAQEVATVSGSRAYERFTGPQIAKIIAERKQEYDNCERISLVSSFITSVLIGDYAPIDISDGSGMNLLDLEKLDWSVALLEATVSARPSSPSSSASSSASASNVKKEVDPHVRELASELARKLGQPKPASDIAGTIAQYFQTKYGLNRQCKVVLGSGDNPCSLAGLRMQQAGDVAVSLGTSDTLFAVIPTASISPSGEEGHVLRSAVALDSCMAMLCFKNGSLVRETVRQALGYKSWDAFNEAVGAVEAGNGGRTAMHFLEPEITPVTTLPIQARFDEYGAPTKKFERLEEEARALIEGQFLNMRVHAKAIGLGTPTRVIATGGGSVNNTILQIIADVFGVNVYTSDVGPNTAAIGSAYRALHGHLCHQANKLIPFGSTFEGSPSQLRLSATPNQTAVQTYKSLLPKFEELQRNILKH